MLGWVETANLYCLCKISRFCECSLTMRNILLITRTPRLVFQIKSSDNGYVNTAHVSIQILASYLNAFQYWYVSNASWPLCVWLMFPNCQIVHCFSVVKSNTTVMLTPEMSQCLLVNYMDLDVTFHMQYRHVCIFNKVYNKRIHVHSMWDLCCCCLFVKCDTCSENWYDQNMDFNMKHSGQVASYTHVQSFNQSKSRLWVCHSTKH